jgi:DNA-binding MarR family transcriptional regulator
VQMGYLTTDYRLLMFIAKGEHALHGFRNKDLRSVLYPESKMACRDRQKTDSGRVTRSIRLLRAHGLIRKVPKANRYVVTDKGRKFSCAVLTASDLAIKELTERAA